MLQTTPKSQWLTTTKVCFSLLLHVLCGLAACLYSGNQTARSTLSVPGVAGTEEGRARLARALRASTQEPVPSNPVPIAKRVPRGIRKVGSVFVPQGRTQALRNENRICHNYEVLGTLPGMQKSPSQW